MFTIFCLELGRYFFYFRILINLLPVRRHFLFFYNFFLKWKIISPETSKNTIISGRRSPSREVHESPSRLPTFSLKKNVTKIIFFTYIRVNFVLVFFSSFPLLPARPPASIWCESKKKKKRPYMKEKKLELFSDFFNITKTLTSIWSVRINELGCENNIDK